jgi:hypothetical protein
MIMNEIENIRGEAIVPYLMKLYEYLNAWKGKWSLQTWELDYWLSLGPKVTLMLIISKHWAKVSFWYSRGWTERNHG